MARFGLVVSFAIVSLAWNHFLLSLGGSNPPRKPHDLSDEHAVQDTGSEMSRWINRWREDRIEIRDHATGKILAKWSLWNARDVARLSTAARSLDAEMAARAAEALRLIRFWRFLHRRDETVQPDDPIVVIDDTKKTLAWTRTVTVSRTRVVLKWSSKRIIIRKRVTLTEVMDRWGVELTAGERIDLVRGFNVAGALHARVWMR